MSPARDLEGLFPALKATGYTITSPVTKEYNCIAWAAGDDTRWWQPFSALGAAQLGGYYWPDGLDLSRSLENYERAFKRQGYRGCADAELEEGFEKVAIFVKDSIPTHAARQLPDGAWTSKCGPLEDIRHEALEGVAGDEYGQVAMILRRPVRDAMPPPQARNILK